MTEKIEIQTAYITLGQLLKRAGFIETGGRAKWFLAEYAVYVNGDEEKRRGRKLYTGDTIELPDIGSFVITH